MQFAGQVFPFMFLSYYTILTLEVFVPVQGRSGPSVNPDSIIAITSIFLGTLMSYMMPTFSLFKRPIIVLSGFLVVFVAFIIVIATPVGFPFQSNTPQRFWIFVSFWIVLSGQSLNFATIFFLRAILLQLLIFFVQFFCNF